MTYYEILKESKIVYEYLIDILDNADIQSLDNNQGKIKEFLTVISDIYENTYNQTKKYNKNDYYEIAYDDLLYMQMTLSSDFY